MYGKTPKITIHYLEIVEITTASFEFPKNNHRPPLNSSYTSINRISDFKNMIRVKKQIIQKGRANDRDKVDIY